MFIRRQFPVVTLFLALIIATLYPHVAAAQDRQGAPVTSLARIREAVVHIVSVGAAWQYDEADPSVEVGAGSGFIVNPAGIVVTNAHVVNGGNLFEVYLYGESEPRNAVLLGVSECDDLAVLDIRGSGFPYLLWQETPVASAQIVYAAGYPDGQYTETRGRVQESGRRGDTDWASVDQVVRHTAELHPGNSGGPLLNRSGRVSGVNFAVNDEESTFFAITKEIAIPLVEQLAGGQDVDSIGINGLAFDESDDWFGIWVVAVKSGSPADRAGLRPGDIIYRMEGIGLAGNGTMRDYCDILRSHRPGEAIEFDALRGGEYYVGQINGRPMVVRADEATAEDSDAEAASDALTADAGETMAEAASTAPALEPPAGYHLVRDASGAMQFFVPDAWDEDASAKIVQGSAVFGPSYMVFEDFGQDNMYATAGLMSQVWFLGEESLDDELDQLQLEECQFVARQDVRTDDFVGRVDLWKLCDGSLTGVAATAALHPTWDDGTTVHVTVIGLEQVISLETLLLPLGAALREHAIYWDIPYVIIDSRPINVRAGPGVAFEKRGELAVGNSAAVLGKNSSACTWYYVRGEGVEGWIASDSQYSTLDRDCSTLKVVTEDAVRSFELE